MNIKEVLPLEINTRIEITPYIKSNLYMNVPTNSGHILLWYAFVYK